jgi:hypothetical protein
MSHQDKHDAYRMLKNKQNDRRGAINSKPDQRGFESNSKPGQRGFESNSKPGQRGFESNSKPDQVITQKVRTTGGSTRQYVIAGVEGGRSSRSTPSSDSVRAVTGSTSNVVRTPKNVPMSSSSQKQHISNNEYKTVSINNKKPQPKKERIVYENDNENSNTSRRTEGGGGSNLSELDEYRIINFKPKDNYLKLSESKQDEISKDQYEVDQRFVGFKLIPEEDYRCIQPGTYIRYMKEGTLYRAGGVLKLNKWPKYWVLESVDGKKIKWSVPLQNTKSEYFMKDMQLYKEKQKTKDKLYDGVLKEKFVVLDRDEFIRMKNICDAEGFDASNSYYDSQDEKYSDEESSVNVDVQFEKKHKKY